MHVLITKQPDGPHHLTKAGFGVLFDDDVTEGDAVVFGDHSVQIRPDGHAHAEPDDRVIWFSWVDYLTMNTPGTPLPEGIRHTEERRIPCDFGCGPYTVEVTAGG